jgi:hypothetical protein
MANIIFSIASNLNDSVYGKSIAPIKALIEKRAEAYEQETVRNKLFKVIKTNTWAVKFGSMTAMDGPKPVGENGPYPQDGYQEGYSKTIEHDTWKDAFSVTQEMIEDTNFIELAKKPAAFIAAYYRRMEVFAAQMFGGAINGAAVDVYGRKYDVTGADGLAAFHYQHPSKTQAGYTQSNRFSGFLTQENLGKLETHMQMFTDDDGNILNIAPDTILIPNDAAMKEKAFVAIGSDQKPGGANNDMNYQYGRWNIIVWPYLNQFITITSGTTEPWIMLDSKYIQQYDAAIWANRVENRIKSYIDESTDANVWHMRSRFGVGFNDWRAFAVAGLAASGTSSSSTGYTAL